MTTKTDTLMQAPTYQAALSLGIDIYGLTLNDKDGMKADLREAAVSMVLNLASGLSQWEPRWKLPDLHAARHAASKIVPMLDLLKGSCEMPRHETEPLREAALDVEARITGLLREAQRQANGGETES